MERKKNKLGTTINNSSITNYIIITVFNDFSRIKI